MTSNSNESVVVTFCQLLFSNMLFGKPLSIAILETRLDKRLKHIIPPNPKGSDSYEVE